MSAGFAKNEWIQWQVTPALEKFQLGGGVRQGIGFLFWEAFTGQLFRLALETKWPGTLDSVPGYFTSRLVGQNKFSNCFGAFVLISPKTRPMVSFAPHQSKTQLKNLFFEKPIGSFKDLLILKAYGNRFADTAAYRYLLPFGNVTHEAFLLFRHSTVVLA